MPLSKAADAARKRKERSDHKRAVKDAEIPAADDSSPTRGRQRRRSTPESKEKDAARKKGSRERNSTSESKEKDAARKKGSRERNSTSESKEKDAARKKGSRERSSTQESRKKAAARKKLARDAVPVAADPHGGAREGAGRSHADPYLEAFEHQEDVARRQVAKIEALMSQEELMRRKPTRIVDGKEICVHPENWTCDNCATGAKCEAINTRYAAATGIAMVIAANDAYRDHMQSSLVSALADKETGNALFKRGDTEGAIAQWLSGREKLDGLNVEGTGDPQTKALLLALHTNIAMGMSKMQHWKEAVSSASSAIDLDSTSVKALYRRGMALRKMGELDRSKADLTEALRLDPSLKDAKRELLALRKQEKEEKEKAKVQFGGAFSRGGSLYTDKAGEAAARKKKKEVAK